MVSNEGRQCMKDFYVNNTTKLEQFGFQQTKTGEFVYCYVRKNGYSSTISLYVNSQTGRVVIQSPSREAIALLCELYKQGILEIIDDNDAAVVRMNLTPEEAEMVRQLRTGKRNK